MRRLRFTLDVCYTSRGELVGGSLRLKYTLASKGIVLGGWTGREHMMLDTLIGEMRRRIYAATVKP